MHRRGFTLIEVIIVIAIMGIGVAAVAGPLLTAMEAWSRSMAANDLVFDFRGAVDRFAQDLYQADQIYLNRTSSVTLRDRDPKGVYAFQQMNYSPPGWLGGPEHFRRGDLVRDFFSTAYRDRHFIWALVSGRYESPTGPPWEVRYSFNAYHADGQPIQSHAAVPSPFESGEKEAQFSPDESKKLNRDGGRVEMRLEGKQVHRGRQERLVWRMQYAWPKRLIPGGRILNERVTRW